MLASELTSGAGTPSITQGRALVLTGAWSFCGLLAYTLEPRLAPGLLPLCIVAPLAWCWMHEGRLPRLMPPRAVVTALLFASVYLLVNSSWSPAKADAYAHIGALIAFIVATHATLALLPGMGAPAVRVAARGILAALVIGGAILCFEAASGQWLRRALFTHVLWFPPDARNMYMEGGRATYAEPFLLNWSMSALVLMLWPAVLLIKATTADTRLRALSLLALLPGVAAVVQSQHASSKLALASGLAAFVSARVWVTLTRRSLAVCWIGMTMLVVPAATLAYANHLYLSDRLVQSARHRIVIWGYTSGLVADKPLLGHGVDAARAYGAGDRSHLPRAPGTDFPLSTSIHSHNIYLQAWFDAGALGAGMLLCIGLLLLRTIGTMREDMQPHLLALFASGAVLAASSFSLWQPWFLASFCLAAVVAATGLAACSKPVRP
jgi:O-antigen ligase